MSRLLEKAKGITFDDADEGPTQGDLTPSSAAGRSRTGIGAITRSIAMDRSVQAENAQLRKELQAFEDATIVEFLDPTKIVDSDYANRHPDTFATEAFNELKAEIASAGRNTVPIKVRPRPDHQGQYEVVYGHRRLRACSDLGIPVAAIVEELSVAELFAEMDRENRQRKDLTPWEQGVMYDKALSRGLFPSQRRMSEELGVPLQSINGVVQLARLPSVVVEAFPSPLELQVRWGAALNAALRENSDAVLARAQALASARQQGGGLPAKQTLAELLKAAEEGAEASKAARSPEDIPLVRNGKPVGALRVGPAGQLSLSLKAGSLSAHELERVKAFLTKLLS